MRITQNILFPLMASLFLLSVIFFAGNVAILSVEGGKIPLPAHKIKVYSTRGKKKDDVF